MKMMIIKTIMKKITAITMAASVFVSGLSIITLSASAQEVNYRTSCGYFEGRLTGEAKNLYNNLLEVCKKVNTNFKKDYDFSAPGAEYNSSLLSAEQAKEVYYLFVLDHPEFYWISTIFTLATAGETSSINITINPKYRTASSRKSASSAIESAVAGYVEGALAYSNPYDRALYLHDALVKNISYNNSGTLDNYQTIASALIDKSTVCAGYSRAYTYLCNAVGIDAISVFASEHEWTMVKIGSEWYCVDVTYDDTQSSHNYFLCDYTSFQKGASDGSHLVDSSQLVYYANLFPSCTSKDGGKNALSWGDLNNDSVIDSKDVEIMNNPSSLSSEQKAAADLDCNGVVDQKDIEILSEYLSGKISKLPALEYPITSDADLNFTDTGVLGDVNGDGSVDSKDAVYVLIDYARTLVGHSSSLNKDVSDINKDGNINSADAVGILQYYAERLINPSLGGMEEYLNAK